jgi:hypothetical protein
MGLYPVGFYWSVDFGAGFVSVPDSPVVVAVSVLLSALSVEDDRRDLPA